MVLWGMRKRLRSLVWFGFVLVTARGSHHDPLVSLSTSKTGVLFVIFFIYSSARWIAPAIIKGPKGVVWW